MTPHFTKAELTCKCGCGMIPEQDFMDKVERLRVAFGRPLAVSSAARCPAYNAKVSSTGTTGPHTTGRAIDLLVARKDAYDFLMLLGRQNYLGLGFTGIGVKQHGAHRFVHLDDLPDAPGHPRPTVWSYS